MAEVSLISLRGEIPFLDPADRIFFPPLSKLVSLDYSAHQNDFRYRTNLYCDEEQRNIY